MKMLFLLKSKLVGLSLLVVAQFIFSFNVFAQDDNAIASDLQVCATLRIAAAKEACYDNLAQHAAQQSKPAQPKPAKVSNASSQSKSNSSNKPKIAAPVLAQPKAPVVAQPVVEKAAAKPDDVGLASARAEEVVVGTVASVKKLGQQNKYSLTLENGQVWWQVAAKQFRLRKGDKVNIKGIAGSSYRLYVEGRKGFIRVKRFK